MATRFAWPGRYITLCDLLFFLLVLCLSIASFTTLNRLCVANSSAVIEAVSSGGKIELITLGWFRLRGEAEIVSSYDPGTCKSWVVTTPVFVSEANY